MAVENNNCNFDCIDESRTILQPKASFIEKLPGVTYILIIVGIIAFFVLLRTKKSHIV